MLYKTSEKLATSLFTKVESIRKRKGLSRVQAASDMGVSAMTIRNLEKGLCSEKTLPRVKFWLRSNQPYKVNK